ncbi:MAG TPA: glycoside hydrolase family 15 protein [Nitrococcus sp.]|nr:glycoside hydrolase family 15 protein [Nitrococcus sp.]
MQADPASADDDLRRRHGIPRSPAGKDEQRTMTQPSIRDLGLIGNRRSAAAIDRRGNIVWYCPERFDRPSLFASLLDPAAGAWRIQVENAEPLRRRYVGESVVLETELQLPEGTWRLTDWMPADSQTAMLCRRMEAAPRQAVIELAPRPGYGQQPPRLERRNKAVVINEQHYLYASIDPELGGDIIRFRIPRGAAAWFVLADGPLAAVNARTLLASREATLRYWNDLHRQTDYRGPYERQVKDSLRALRLLTLKDNGGIIAAATLGLPEVLGGSRNYDYRYVWLRDAAMIVSALVRAGSKGTEERRFLAFLCDARERLRNRGEARLPPPPFTTLDGETAPKLSELPWRGYRDSSPVLLGNGAGEQLQLDGIANVLLAAKLIYNSYGTREHWETVAELADYLAAHWQEPDHGIWEEGKTAQYTTGKVVSAVALRFIAEHADDPKQARRWLKAVAEINAFVARHCITTDGAYAAVAGGQAVDVSAALYPVWDFCPADTSEMRATMARLECEASPDGLLYRRHLECFDASQEGAFLAGTLWVAQYWVMREELEKAQRILAAVLDCGNDLGLFAEEAEPVSREMLGNFPQTFVHAALVGLAVDLEAAMANQGKK